MKGILNVNKPQEHTSHDCVAIIRRLTGMKRVGHTGTLDPMATGVLPVCLGNATRIMEYLDLDEKEYRCTMKLGLTTDTLDVWGRTLDERETDGITDAMIGDALNSFLGDIEQIPPMYSAVRVAGRRLYEYARAGEEVSAKARKVHISEIKLLDIRDGQAEFTVKCSKGTYIRSICADAGEKLGCGAAMSALERTASGIFRIEDAVGLQELKEMAPEEIAGLLKDTDYPLTHFGKIALDSRQAADIINGRLVAVDAGQITADTSWDARYRVYWREQFIGIADMTAESCLKADKIFNTEIFNTEIG